MKTKITFLTVIVLAAVTSVNSQQPHVGPVLSFNIPEYPILARQAAIQGTVKLTVRFNSQGKILGIDSVGPKILREAAESNVRTWKLNVPWFKQDNGGKEYSQTVTFNYCIRGGSTNRGKDILKLELPNLVTITTQPVIPTP